MKLHIIFDSRRMEKYDPLMQELKEQAITNYILWPAVILPNVVESINASHKMLVRYAKDQGMKEIIIGEDDLLFPSPSSWQYFLANKPETYDLYLACTYADRLAKQTVGFHLYAVHEQFYDKFLSVPDTEHIDTAMWAIGAENYHFCYPYPALQRKGFSSNNKSIQDYNTVLTESDIYRG